VDELERRRLSLVELAANVPPLAPPSYGNERLVENVLRSEVGAGKVEIEDGSYSLNRQAFPTDLLQALERLGRAD
jgi:hypothetical protein